MGAGSNFSNGSNGNGLATRGGILNNHNKNAAIIKKDPLLGDLINRGVKIDPKKVVFTAKDKSGQVVWLESGNEKSGLQHIRKHTKDFVSKHNIQDKHLVGHLKNVIKKGVVVSSRQKTLANGKIGVEKIYRYKGKYYTLGAIGTNGYIVSMYPIDGGE